MTKVGSYHRARFAFLQRFGEYVHLVRLGEVVFFETRGQRPEPSINAGSTCRSEAEPESVPSDARKNALAGGGPEHRAASRD